MAESWSVPETIELELATGFLIIRPGIPGALNAKGKFTMRKRTRFGVRTLDFDDDALTAKDRADLAACGGQPLASGELDEKTEIKRRDLVVTVALET